MKKAINFREQVCAVVRKIPRGRVATYGQIAAMAGAPGRARQVGWALHGSSEKEDIPWHRVVNYKGKISLPKHNGYEVQLALLKSEGVRFDEQESISFDAFGWQANAKEL